MSREIPFTVDSNRTVKAVITYFGIKEEQVLLKTRRNPICRARQVIAYLLRKRIWSLKQIGDLFGQDHTTIINSCQVVQDLIDTEPEFATIVEEIKKKLYA